MKKVYFPQEDIVDVTIDDYSAPEWRAKHIGFAYKPQTSKNMTQVYAIVIKNDGDSAEEVVNLNYLFNGV